MKKKAIRRRVRVVTSQPSGQDPLLSVAMRDGVAMKSIFIEWLHFNKSSICLSSVVVTSTAYHVAFDRQILAEDRQRSGRAEEEDLAPHGRCAVNSRLKRPALCRFKLTHTSLPNISLDSTTLADPSRPSISTNLQQ